jgi:LPXTG-motif cell wall-anchored protein
MVNLSMSRPAVSSIAMRLGGVLGVVFVSLLLLTSVASAQYADGQTVDRGSIDDGRSSSENLCDGGEGSGGNAGNAGNTTGPGQGSGGNAGNATGPGQGSGGNAGGCVESSQGSLQEQSVNPVNLPAAANQIDTKALRSNSAQGQSLPVTGGDVLTLTAIGGAAVLGGTLLVRSARRRRDPIA